MEDKTTTEKCIEIMHSNLRDELKIELISILNKPVETPVQPIIWPSPSPMINKRNWWDDQPMYRGNEITCKAEDVLRG